MMHAGEPGSGFPAQTSRSKSDHELQDAIHPTRASRYGIRHRESDHPVRLVGDHGRVSWNRQATAVGTVEGRGTEGHQRRPDYCGDSAGATEALGWKLEACRSVHPVPLHGVAAHPTTARATGLSQL